MTTPQYIYTKSYRNPTSDTDGFITILGSEEKVETFASSVTGIAIKASTNNIYIQLSNDGITYDDKILMEASSYKTDIFTLSYQCKSVKFTNENTSGSYNGKYQLIGFEV